MAVVRKKQDDKFLKVLRELVTTGGGNRQCFDCGQKGPNYVNMTIGSFVCTRCSGVLRGLTPPHRVKSISMATFTQEEIDFLKSHGNDLCAKTWLGLWDPKRSVHQDHRELMIDKYERKRYYLEPASPLKSLTNAASLKSNNSSSSNTTSSHTQLTNGYGNHTTSNNNNSSSAISNITLTPPTSQRTTQNGLHKSSSTAISRPQQNGYHHQHNHHHQQQQQQQQHKQHDAFMANNGQNGLVTSGPNGLNGLNVSIGSGNSTSTGALSDTSSCASNGFGPDADFVADFGSANIFDATSASSVGSPAVSSASSVASSNGYAKIQPIKAAHFMNGNAAAAIMMNGNANVNARNQQNVQNNKNNNNIVNGHHSTFNGNTENFADFDHAPIYNAAGLPMTNGISNKNPTTASSANVFNNNVKNAMPAEDRYAALKDLDEQLRESKAVAAAAASVVASSVTDSFVNNNHSNGNVNPFKNQQQQQQQVNPFQAVQQQQQPQQPNLFGQMSTIPNGLTANGFSSATIHPQHTSVPVAVAQQQQQQQTLFYNYNNGFSTTGATSTMFPPPSNGPNGCGFGFGSMQQQISATAGGGAFNNPFAATGGVLNSNNPFL